MKGERNVVIKRSVKEAIFWVPNNDEPKVATTDNHTDSHNTTKMALDRLTGFHDLRHSRGECANDSNRYINLW